MYLRIALSVLIDSDWNDTACFFKDIPLEKRLSTEETYDLGKNVFEILSNI